MTSYDATEIANLLKPIEPLITLPIIIVDSALNERFNLFISKYKRPYYICDENTYHLAKSLVNKNKNIIILSNGVKASEVEANKLALLLGDADIIVAVGSGTINDLCKYVSYNLKKAYLIYATAPSMNGYLSTNASIYSNGLSCSYSVHGPVALFMDLDVLIKAPKRLIASGFADVVCSYTARKDWMLSHRILGSYYSNLPYEWLWIEQKKLISLVDELLKENKEAIRVLCNCLIISGLGMVYCKGSYPASQSEHILCHYLGGINSGLNEIFFHGELIAVTTLTVANLQDSLFIKEEFPRSKIDLIKGYERGLNKLITKKMQEIVKKELNFKIDAVQTMNEICLKKNWQIFRDEVLSLKLDSQDLRICFQVLDLPLTYSDLSISSIKYEEAVKIAAITRNRFTILDLIT